MLSVVDLTAIDHLADIETVLKKIRERANTKRAPADRAPARYPPGLAGDPRPAEVLRQRAPGAKLEIARKDGADRLRLGRDHHDLFVHRRIAERDRTADPNALALGGGDLIPHPFPDHLALE